MFFVQTKLSALACHPFPTPPHQEIGLLPQSLNALFPPLVGRE